MDHELFQEGSSSSVPQVSVILTVRLLMQGKEVGSIIGKRGDHIKYIREESGAKINISDGSCPERIVTITGNVDTINKAFSMICNKFQEDMQALPNSVPKPPITMRLIVPATQCGSLIGKGGSKIKEIREATGASIQVASEMLPNSTERAVTISGTADAIVLCMQQICHILLEAPPKGTTIPYRPKPSFNPLLLASSAAAAAAAQRQAATAAALLQPFPASMLTSSDLARLHSQYAATQLLPAVPVLTPNPDFSVFASGGLIALPTAEHDTLKDIPTAAAVAAAANRWNIGADEKQAELLQSLAVSQHYIFGNSMLSRTIPVGGGTKQIAQPSIGQTAASALLQPTNPRRYTPY
uniref:Poly(RC)-binding protein 3 n=1 Tax=Syphacia muris TaxID=451379 RepID=A0A158R5T2_9BILA